MRALVAAGARQKPGQQDRRDQPGERGDLECGGRAAHRQIDRECRKRRQASEQPRRDERAMARARQRVVARRRMQQRIETIADDIQNAHGFRASACSSRSTRRNAPFIVAPPCQSEIKRTLRRRCRRSKTVCLRDFRRWRDGSFDPDGEHRVSSADFVWFRNGGCARRMHPSCIIIAINRKFTPNQISRIFGGFSKI